MAEGQCEVALVMQYMPMVEFPVFLNVATWLDLKVLRINSRLLRSPNSTPTGIARGSCEAPTRMLQDTLLGSYEAPGELLDSLHGSY